MFKNKLYNTIIAVSLIVAIMVVSTYAPDILPGESKSDKTITCNEVKGEKPQIRVASAKKYSDISQVMEELEGSTEGEKQKDTLNNLGKLIKDTEETVKKEVRNAKKNTTSEEIIKRADSYEKLAMNGLNRVSEKIEKLSEKMKSGTVSGKEVNVEIASIKSEIEDMQKYDEPKVDNNDEAHGMATGYESEKIIGEQMVKSDYINYSADSTEAANESYLKINENMKKTADSLETPAEIYEYVRNNIQYRQYTGLRLGAIGTYEQKAGNDLDQAALLIALLRYKGYEARFVTGNVDIEINKVMNWLGVKTEKAAVNAMSMLGVSTNYGINGKGKITKLRIEHAWVKVLVPYDSYRGAGKVSGEKVWVDVDPSFKQYEEEVEDNRVEEFLRGDTEKNVTSSSTEKLEEALINSDYKDIFNGEIQNSENEVSQKQSELKDFINNNDIELKEVADAVGIRNIKKVETGYLPNSLPYHVVSTTYEENYLTDDFMDKITLAVNNALYGETFAETTDASITFYTADLYGHNVTLSYEPATDEDKKIIDRYGDLFSTPSYLVRVKPVIKVDEQRVLEGNSQIPGTYTNLIINIAEAGIDEVKVENPLASGGIYGIVFDYNTINSTYFDTKYEELQSCVDEVKSGKRNLIQAMEVLTCTVGQEYFGYLDLYTQLSAKAAGVQWARCISQCIVGYMPKVSRMMGMPVAISDGSLYIDVDTDTLGVAPKQDESENKDEAIRENADVKNFMMLSGAIGSYLEGYVIGEATDTQGISSISVIEEAKERGIDVLTLSKEDTDKLNSLSINENTKKEIQKALNNGKLVIVPEKEISYYDWQGTGYIVLNTENGAASYMIAGGLCGGQSSSELGFVMFTVLVAVAAVFTIATYEYFALCAMEALVNVLLSMEYGISILDICVVILGITGAYFSVTEAADVGEKTIEYMKNADYQTGREILGKALEATVMLLIFEHALPKIMKNIKYDESGFFRFISKKYGGKTILEIGDDVKPPKPGREDPKDPDVNPENPKVDPKDPDVDPEKPGENKPGGEDSGSGGDSGTGGTGTGDTGTGRENPEPGNEIPEPGKEIPEPGKEIPEPGKEIPEPGKEIPEPGKEIPEPGKEIPEPGKENPNPGEEGTGGNNAIDDYWDDIKDRYGEMTARELEPFGKDGRALIKKYEENGNIHDVIDVINSLPETDEKKGIQLMIDYPDDAVTLLKNKNTLSLSKTLCRGLKENEISIGRFQELKLKPLNNGTYTEREKEIIKSIRERFTINKNTLLRKYIKPEQVEKYVSGDYTSVQGCISRAEDYSDVGDFRDIYYSFRLDYAPPKGGVPDYSPTQTSYWKIEFKTLYGELEKINLENTYGNAFGGSNTLPDPCTQNAFTGSENGKVIPEWNLEKGVKYRKDSLITKIERGRVVEQYKFSDGIWRKVK